MKLLVINLDGIREVLEINQGGGYFDRDRVLWDERVDGDMPDIEISGAVRVDDDLLFNGEVAQANSNLKVTLAASENNARIITDLEKIDAKSIRALREGDQVRISNYEAEAAALRAQLVKD